MAGRTKTRVPLDRLWKVFSDVAMWPAWNPCIRWARVERGSLAVGRQLTWVFEPIRPTLPYKLPAVARIVECRPLERLTWSVDLPGFEALHSYSFDEADGGSVFGSWEIARGSMYRSLRRFWLAHFRFVRDASLAGARSLGYSGLGRVRLLPFGSPSRQPPLVAVPGIDGSPGSIAPIVERLAADRQVYVVDYRGETNPTLEGLTEEVRGLIDREVLAEGASRIDLLGQSIGTIVAARLSSSIPEVRRVVLVATFRRLRSMQLAVARAVAEWTPRSLYEASTVPLMSFVCGPVGDGGDHPFLRAVRESDRWGSLRRTGWQIGRDFTPELRALHEPALVLMGTADRFVPDIAEEIAGLQRLYAGRDVRVQPVPGAGHVLLPRSAVNMATSAIEGFLA